MMAIETKIWDPAELLRTPEDIAAYLDTYLEDGDSEEHRSLARHDGAGPQDRSDAGSPLQGAG